MGSQSGPSVAFILSLIGGILMLISGLMFTMWLWVGGNNPWGMMGGNWNGNWGMMGNWSLPFGMMSGLWFVSLIAGIIVLIGALMLNTRPSEHMTWGVLILIFSIVSLVGMGGFFLGAILGIAGGAMALSWRPASGA